MRATRLLGTLENIFTLDGETGHEIVWVYDAEFVDESLYERDLDGMEDTVGSFKAYWKPLDAFEPRGGGQRLVPEGLLELLGGVEDPEPVQPDGSITR